MSANDDLLDILRDALTSVGVVIGRRMFGGIGVYFDATFFALIDDGVMYFKVSESSRANFEAERSQPFTYQTKNGPGALHSYWRVPERLMDDPEEMRDWARTAIAAARDARREDGRRKTAERPDAKANAIGTARSVWAKPRPLSKNR
jgi:DNA transformation protein